MKCVICQYGETEPGTTTVALTREDTTIAIRDVPALICTTCGEEYVDAAPGRRLSQIAEKAVSEGPATPRHPRPYGRENPRKNGDQTNSFPLASLFTLYKVPE